LRAVTVISSTVMAESASVEHETPSRASAASGYLIINSQDIEYEKGVLLSQNP
jgi:hypothetical protein